MLRIYYLQDNHAGHVRNFIKFRDIVSQSIIVRTPQTSVREQNQRAAFILCNANDLEKMGIDNYFIYPEKENVAEFINNMWTAQ